MTCLDCQTLTSFNMSNICCIARHIKMQFIPAHESKSEREVRNEYAKRTIKQYGFSLDELIAEFERVNNVHGRQ